MSDVLIWHAQRSYKEEGSDLCNELVRRGWWSVSQRVVLQLDLGSRRDLILSTARSLVDYLRLHQPSTIVSVVAPGPLSLSEKARFGEVTWLGADAQDGLVLASPCLPDGVKVPFLWLQSFSLITVSSPRPGRCERVFGPLLAQSVLLMRDGADRLYACELVSEAHRLAASDLSIICGYRVPKEPDSGMIWMISPNDVALELALEEAAGLKPGSLPVLKYLARHYLVSLRRPEIEGEVPDWGELAAPAWIVVLFRPAYAVARWLADVQRDLLLIRQNLWRVPRFLRRHLLRGANA